MLCKAPLNHFELITLKSGVISLRSIERGETFHPGIGPRVEAHILHVEQQRLVERSSAASSKFVIWDVGFGAAANVLTAIEALRGTNTEIEIHSFDKTTAPIEFAMSHSSELGYLANHLEPLRQLLSQGSIQIAPRIQWHLHLGDFSHQVYRPDLPSPHAIFYDPYSPSGNPEMWTLDHFTALRKRLDPATPCLLTNYTRSTAVRVALLLSGFYVGVGCIVGEKAETTIASNHLDLLEAPLRRDWLKRVKVSGNAAPLRAATYSLSPISEADLQGLQNLAQFTP